MVRHKQCMEKLKKLKDKKIIKVATGVRRCGKSTLLLPLMTRISERIISREFIILFS